MSKINIPVIKVEEKTLPEAWERAVVETWQNGTNIKTEYDKSTDPPSRDCTMIMVVQEPMSEPRIHRAFPGGLEDLEVYTQEVVDGIHDHWISPEEGKWTYTYHKRLFGYEMEGEVVDQINQLILKLSSVPFSRRAQAITWNPKLDPPTDDPPCLQRLFCRITEKDDTFYLNMNSHWRSRDAYKAAFMNIFALTALQARIAEEISKKINKVVKVGRYADITDSFHIYGAYAEEFKNFLNIVKSRSFEQRTWPTKFARPFFEKAKQRIQKEQEINSKS